MNHQHGQEQQASELPKTPSITIGWDAEAQGVTLHFKSNEFKTWDFVLALLDMAKQKAETLKRVAQMNALQQQAAQAHHDQVIANKIFKGR